jgi:hypothetical protein
MLACVVLLIARGAAGDGLHALSGGIESPAGDPLSDGSVPDALTVDECNRDGGGPERHAFSGKIEGRVLDSITGRGVPGVFVQAERNRDGRRCVSEPTDASGHYLLKVTLSDPDGEPFRARTMALDYADASGSGTLFLGRPLRLDFRVALRPTATVSGTVLDADTDTPVANARVAVACLPACNGIRHPPALTGPDGRYELRGVPFSPTGPVESGTPISVTVPASVMSSRCYPLYPERLDINDFDVTRDILLRTTLPCGIVPLPPPPPPRPASCATPPSTIDNNGRLVTYCLGPANETDVAVNPQNPRNIVSVAKDYSLGEDVGNTCTTPTHRTTKWEVWTGVYTSFDGGVTWSNDLLPGFPGDNRPTNVPSQRCMTDPVIAFTPDGKELYLVAMAWGAPVRRIFHPELPLREFHLILARSNDGGVTWLNIQSIYRGFTTIRWPDKPSLAIDPDYASNGTVYVAWDLVPEPNELDQRPQLTTVINGEVVSLEDVPGIGSLPTVAVLKDHSVVVIGLGSRPATGAGCGCIAVSRRTVAGNWVPNGSLIGFYSYGETSATSNNYRAVVIPTVAVDRSGGPSDGNVAVAWHTGSPPSSMPAVFSSLKVAYSSDIKMGGSTWNPVDPPAATGPFQQVLPRVAVSPLGVVALLYYEDALSGTTPLTARYLGATGSGQPVWAAPAILSVPFSPAKMFHQTGDVFIGDYVGLSFDSAGDALATWADGRRDRSDIFFKSIATLIP